MVTKRVEGRAPWLLSVFVGGGAQHVVYPPVIWSAGTGHISFRIGRGLPACCVPPCDTECGDWAYFLRNKPRVAGHPPRGSELGPLRDRKNLRFNI